MSNFEVKKDEAYELVSWECGPVWKDDGSDRIAIYPTFRGPGQPLPVAAPPMVLTEAAASKLIEHLTIQVAHLQAKKASPHGSH